MSWNFKFIDHTADIAAKLEGSTIEELFIAGAEAWVSSVTEKTDFNADDNLKIEIESGSNEELLVSFLNELNFLLTVKKWLCLKVDSVQISFSSDKFILTANLKGIKLNKKVQLKEEIKSVTYHQMEIKKENEHFFTRVVFDI